MVRSPVSRATRREFSAKLLGDESGALNSQTLFFGLGANQFPGSTNGSGVAAVDFPLVLPHRHL